MVESEMVNKACTNEYLISLLVSRISVTILHIGRTAAFLPLGYWFLAFHRCNNPCCSNAGYYHCPSECASSLIACIFLGAIPSSKN